MTCYSLGEALAYTDPNAPSAKEAYGRQTQDEWAESRKAEGWSAALVEAAMGAGALSEVRAAVRSETFNGPPRFHRAVRAVAIIDAGRALETVYPRLRFLAELYGQDR